MTRLLSALGCNNNNTWPALAHFPLLQSGICFETIMCVCLRFIHCMYVMYLCIVNTFVFLLLCTHLCVVVLKASVWGLCDVPAVCVLGLLCDRVWHLACFWECFVLQSCLTLPSRNHFRIGCRCPETYNAVSVSLCACWTNFYSC